MRNWEQSFPNRTPWTHAQVARLRELRGKGTSFDQIAHEVGHTAYACQSKAVQIGVRAPRGAAVQKCIPTVRPCLCCKQPFNSQGPGNRLCKQCRHLDPGVEPVRFVLR